MWREAARLRRSAPLNIVFDGNSLVYGTGSTGENNPAALTTFPDQTALAVKKRFADVTYTNCGIAGQTWSDMESSHADVDAAWSNSRTNILVLWETTNSICNQNRSAAGAAADAKTYVTNRLATHSSWLILLLGSIPRQTGPAFGNNPSQATLDDFNGRLRACDEIMRASYRAWGCRGFVDLRCPGSPFNLPDNTPTSFAANDALWIEPAGGRVHFRDAGYAIVAALVARAITNLAAR